MLETLLRELQQLERPITAEGKRRLMVEMHTRQAGLGISVGPDATHWMGRGGIYFHSLQDLILVQTNLDYQEQKRPSSEPVPEEEFYDSQACFVRDLETYLKFLAADEDPQNRIREVFELILKVGTSSYWCKDRALVDGLIRSYEALDRIVIRPWVEQAS
ncbi:hypothetical protein HYY73_05990 [Candidatus Woesearchaeota archaeon]|nr:hypothetical protein [Candidatus Woesearchaeota archaeon]